jgi:hypothetical protein
MMGARRRRRTRVAYADARKLRGKKNQGDRRGLGEGAGTGGGQNCLGELFP